MFFSGPSGAGKTGWGLLCQVLLSLPVLANGWAGYCCQYCWLVMATMVGTYATLPKPPWSQAVSRRQRTINRVGPSKKWSPSRRIGPNHRRTQAAHFFRIPTFRQICPKQAFFGAALRLTRRREACCPRPCIAAYCHPGLRRAPPSRAWPLRANSARGARSGAVSMLSRLRVVRVETAVECPRMRLAPLRKLR